MKETVELMLGDTEVIPTGRWKILNLNGDSTLFLECFSYPHKWYEKRLVLKERLVAKRWLVREVYETYEAVESVRKEGLKNFGWVSENSLRLNIKKEFINTCGETNG